MALTWDFARTIAGVNPGNTTSFFDEMTQTFYTYDGMIYTQLGQMVNGAWADISRENSKAISGTGYSVLDVEHHFNGILYAVAQHDGNVVLMIYEYMLDVSKYLQSGSWQLQPDNTIKGGSITLNNGDSRRFEDNAYSLFNPGCRLRCRFRAGDSEPYQICVFFIESSPYAEGGNSFTFTGRNAIGFHLTTQTFDSQNEFLGTRTNVVTDMLVNAGVPASMVIIQADETVWEYAFDAKDTYFKGLTDACKLFDWYFDDLPDGRIVIGDAEFIKSYLGPTGIYEFHRGSDVISRSVDRSIDGVYSKVCVKRGGSNAASLYAVVPYFEGWYVGTNRTYYQDVPDTTTNDEMARIRDQLVEGLQYTGVTESFDGPFRAWLLPGDVATATGGVAPRIVGIMTDIKLNFGQTGFFTQFSVTSGGAISNPENPATVATKYTGMLGGANRKRRLLDYIQNK